MNYSANNTVHLRWRELNDSGTSCVEILGMTINTLSLMIIDSAQT